MNWDQSPWPGKRDLGELGMEQQGRDETGCPLIPGEQLVMGWLKMIRRQATACASPLDGSTFFASWAG